MSPYAFQQFSPVMQRYRVLAVALVKDLGGGVFQGCYRLFRLK